MHTCCSVYAYIYIYIYLYIIYTRELRSIQGMHTCRYWCVPHVHYTVPKKAPLLSSTFVSSTVPWYLLPWYLLPWYLLPWYLLPWHTFNIWYLGTCVEVPRYHHVSCMYAYLLSMHTTVHVHVFKG